MMIETEPVEIWSIDQSRKLGDGYLKIGLHGLPICVCETLFFAATAPWSFPACWSLRPLQKQAPGPLLDAWREIQRIMDEVRIWEHRHEHSVMMEKTDATF